MIYVMSDIHGTYVKYQLMLEKIHFCEQDTLYILGDVIDRGKQGIETLLDMMERPNIIPIIGNHEWMALQCLPWLQKEITEDSLKELHEEQISALALWVLNGAMTTIEEWKRLEKGKRNDLLCYLGRFLPYKRIEANGKRYLLVHSGLGNFKKDKRLEDYTIDELVWIRPDYDVNYFENDDICMVVGHTPTLLIHDKPLIYHGPQLIAVDCGAVFPEGRLACLCLNTMEEFYIE